MTTKSRPTRILVAGGSGAGKSTAARLIAEHLDLGYVEIDSLFHGPDWVPRPEFEHDVKRLIAGERWVTEWQYDVVRDRLAAGAEMLVWLDYPRLLVLARVARRTIRRRLRRIELWNGNFEPPLHTFFSDPDHVVRYAWRNQPKLAGKIDQCLASHPNLELKRFRRPAEFRRWLDALPPPTA